MEHENLNTEVTANNDLGAARYTSKSDKIGFGKYKDKSLDWVGLNDPCYFNWMFNEVKGVSSSIRNMSKDRLILLRFIYDYRNSLSDKYEVWAHTGKL